MLQVQGRAGCALPLAPPTRLPWRGSPAAAWHPLLPLPPLAGAEGKLDSAVAEASQATAQLQQLGTTTLMVTHSLSQALRYGDRLVMLHEGRILGDWNAQERQHLTPDGLREMYGAARVRQTD